MQNKDGQIAYAIILAKSQEMLSSLAIRHAHAPAPVVSRKPAALTRSALARGEA
jgi:hypothetical protein